MEEGKGAITREGERADDDRMWGCSMGFKRDKTLMIGDRLSTE